MDTFETPMFGVLGYVDDRAVRMYRLNGRAMKAGTEDWKTPFNLKTINKEDLPSVGIAYNYQDAGAGAITGMVNDGVKGIVTAGTGAGGISSKLSTERAAAVREGVVFVSTSRTGSGSVYSSGNGIISGDNLDPQHARIMLILTLAFTDNLEQMRTWFATVGTQEIVVNVNKVEEPAPSPEPSPSPTPRPGNSSGDPGIEPSPEPTTTPEPEPTTAPEPETPSIVFTDTSGHWAEEAIAEAVKRNIVQGYSDGSFKPEGQVTRAEFTVMLMRMLGVEQSSTTTSFADDSSIGNWAKSAVAAAVEKGFINGYTDGSFQPNRTINRMEFAVIAVRALGIDTTPYRSTTFSDDQAIAPWAKASIAAAVDAGIIQGKGNNRFDPAGTATRAEAITVIMNMSKNVHKQQ